MVISEEDDGSLNIYPVTTPSEKPLRATLHLEESPDIKALEYNVATYYIQGADRIDIISKKIIPAEQKRKLKFFRLSMPGVEVSEEGANKISYQALIDPAAFRLESLLSKTSAFSLHLQEDAVNSVMNWNFPLAREVIERSGEALRHYRLTIRQVALASISKTIAKEIGVINCRECVTFALMARDLSRLVYHCSQIARHVLALEHKKKVSRGILSLMEALSELVYTMQKDAVQSFLDKDTRLAVQVLLRMSDARKKEEDLLKEVIAKVKDIDTAVTMGLIGRDLRRIAGYSVAIADDGMNRVLTPSLV
ncbi:MAG: phosphate uptake regulator PhoU [Candidatus Bathyarchaeota archaeon]|nr:MAG: phosphate uptake regulator PhoU [Candidatus Bathyarchaeota archaeon]